MHSYPEPEKPKGNNPHSRPAPSSTINMLMLGSLSVPSLHRTARGVRIGECYVSQDDDLSARGCQSFQIKRKTLLEIFKDPQV